MSTTVHVSAVARGDMFSGTSAATVLGATGTLRLYSGSTPADADASLGAAVLLATLTLAASPVTSTTRGVLTLAAIGSVAAVATGTASFWRIHDSSGVSVYQGDVTSIATGTGSLLIATTSIVASATISCSAGSIILPS